MLPACCYLQCRRLGWVGGWAMHSSCALCALLVLRAHTRCTALHARQKAEVIDKRHELISRHAVAE